MKYFSLCLFFVLSFSGCISVEKEIFYTEDDIRIKSKTIFLGRCGFAGGKALLFEKEKHFANEKILIEKSKRFVKCIGCNERTIKSKKKKFDDLRNLMEVTYKRRDTTIVKQISNK